MGQRSAEPHLIEYWRCLELQFGFSIWSNYNSLFPLRSFIWFKNICLSGTHLVIQATCYLQFL